jgi:TonB family protein
MQFIIRYRWALIGTFFLHLGVMLYLQSIPVKAPYQPVGQLEEIRIVLDPEVQEKQQEEKEKLQTENGKISNVTANEADKVGESDKRYDSRSFKNMDAQVEQELRDFEKNAFAQEASTHKTDITIPDDKEKVKVKEKTNDNNANGNDAGKVRAPGRVSGSYDLGGRADEYFAKPAYVCKGSGTIVLKVKVNRNGKVTSAEIDHDRSSYTESCMGENSLKYVYKCKFEAGTQWPDPQSGTVTYTFIAQ